jgi:hypothetical protein
MNLEGVLEYAKTVPQETQLAQGWFLAWVDDRLEIQRYDEDPEERFPSDDEAFNWVASTVE